MQSSRGVTLLEVGMFLGIMTLTVVGTVVAFNSAKAKRDAREAEISREIGTSPTKAPTHKVLPFGYDTDMEF